MSDDGQVETIRLFYTDKVALEKEVDRLKNDGWEAGDVQPCRNCFKVALTKPNNSTK